MGSRSEADTTRNSALKVFISLHYSVPDSIFMKLRTSPLLFSLLVGFPALAEVAGEPQAKSAGTPPAIVSPVKFTDGSLVGQIGSEEIERMGRRELKLGGGHTHDFLSKDGEVIETRTLAAYRDAILGGWNVHGKFAVACAGTYAEAWSIWDFLQKAKPARVSHFGKDWLGTLSVSFLPWYGSDERVALEADVKAGKNLKDYQQSGEIRKLEVEAKSATFEGVRGHRIEWLASGDIDGDGIEDRLIRISGWAIEGSAFCGGSYVVSRKSIDARCSVIEEFLPESGVAH
jgi:hypothetical protein